MEPPDRISSAREIGPATRARSETHGVMLVILCALASCATDPSAQRVDTQTPVAQAGVTPPATPASAELLKSDISTREHIQNAMSALQTGQEANAKKMLDNVVRQDPQNKIARSLLAQIQIDPAKYFGSSESFNYILQPGDTLSSIAQHFLNEPLKFHILARFNGIADPSRLAPGRVIKIPGKNPSNVPVPVAADNTHRDDSARGVSDSRMQQARRLYDAGKYQQAIEAMGGSAPGNNEARDLLVLAYTKYAEELAENENLIDAQSVLENALSIQPGNDKLRKQLKYVQKQREVARLYKAGSEFMGAGDNDKALEAFTALLKLDPKHDMAKQHIASMNAVSVEAIHKDAMIEYGKQNLDQAIALWDRLLALSPTHANAKLYRARAVDLKFRLQKLGQEPAANTD